MEFFLSDVLNQRHCARNADKKINCLLDHFGVELSDKPHADRPVQQDKHDAGQAYRNQLRRY